MQQYMFICVAMRSLKLATEMELPGNVVSVHEFSYSANKFRDLNSCCGVAAVLAHLW